VANSWKDELSGVSCLNILTLSCVQRFNSKTTSELDGRFRATLFVEHVVGRNRGSVRSEVHK
jgi:hypothetical protein